MIIKELYTFGIRIKTVQNLFKKFGINTRLNTIFIKLKQRNKILNRVNHDNLTDKYLKSKIENFKTFYQQINYNKPKLKNGQNSKKKIFQKIQKKKIK